MQATATRPRMYKVLTPIQKANGAGTFWMRIGTGFPGKDPTTMNVYLDALPRGEKSIIHIREMDEEDFSRSRREGPSSDSTPSAPVEDLPF